MFGACGCLECAGGLSGVCVEAVWMVEEAYEGCGQVVWRVWGVFF